jgi:hypothetical protein
MLDARALLKLNADDENFGLSNLMHEVRLDPQIAARLVKDFHYENTNLRHALLRSSEILIHGSYYAYNATYECADEILRGILSNG